MKRQKNYTDAEIQEALLLVEKNKGNVSGTSKELGIPRTTLQQWTKTHSIEAFEKAAAEKSAEVMTKTRQAAEIAFEDLGAKHLPNIDRVISLTIHKGEELLETTRNLKDISVFLKTLAEVAEKFHNPGQAQASNLHVYFQQSTNTYIENLNQ